MKKKLMILIILSILVILGCNEKKEDDEAQKLVFMAGYKPQASLPFVGVYVAQEEGFFEDEGLEVEIKHTGGGGEHLQLLSMGKVDITTQDAAVLLQRRYEPGLPIVSFALVGQKGQQAFAALSDSKIDDLIDWKGKSIGYRGTPPPDLFALISAAGLSNKDVDLINVGFDLRIFTEKKVDIYPLYKSNEPYVLSQWGYDYKLWDAHDYGVPTLGLAFVTSDEILEVKKEQLTKFLKATIRGIEFSIENEAKAIDIVMKYTGPETDRELMRFMLESEIKDAFGENQKHYPIGWQNFDQWNSLAELLKSYDIIGDLDINKVFTNNILNEIK